MGKLKKYFHYVIAFSVLLAGLFIYYWYEISGYFMDYYADRIFSDFQVTSFLFLRIIVSSFLFLLFIGLPVQTFIRLAKKKIKLTFLKKAAEAAALLAVIIYIIGMRIAFTASYAWAGVGYLSVAFAFYALMCLLLVVDWARLKFFTNNYKPSTSN